MGGWIREEVKVGEDAWGEVYGRSGGGMPMIYLVRCSESEFMYCYCTYINSLHAIVYGC